MEKLNSTIIDIKKFLTEINTYFKSKEDDCLKSIENSCSELEFQFKENSISQYSNNSLGLFENFQNSNILKIPSPIHIGNLKPLLPSDNTLIISLVDFVSSNGLCVELDNSNKQEAHQFLQNIGLKILLSMNPDVINMILFDPDGSGSNFKLLCGYEKTKSNLVLNKSEIGNKLSEVIANFNKLQTESLTFKYDDLEELNLNETKLTKPYTFIFISNYPSGFNNETQNILHSIISKGSKFGTFVFMSHNPLLKPEYGKIEEAISLMNDIGLLRKQESGYKLYNAKESELYNKHFGIELDSENPQRASEIILHLNNAAKISSTKSISQDEYFNEILNEKKELWKEYLNNDDSNKGIDVPVGLKSATEELLFTIDCGTDNYHSIIGGKTGSGKTVLLDNIIINAAIKYSPEELQFVLLDFKGASFQKYRNLPHLRILFGGNDRSYGLNVLRFLNEENTRRQSILATLGGKINALNRNERIEYNFPRLIIILDEFQILLKQLDSVKDEASKHIDTIAQQGRSAGMHLILSSQDLTGITISDSTQFNSNLRIALQMDPQACKQIFSMENTEASLLQKKGEAIFNEKPGRPKFGNQRFQIYKLDDSKSKEIVEFLNKKYESISKTKTIDRFLLPNENSASITNNLELIQQLSPNANKVLYPKIYIGEPAFIKINKKTNRKEDSYIQFKRAENANILITGNDISAASSILGLALLQLINQNKNCQIHLLNNFGGDKIQWRERFKLIESRFDIFKYYQKSQLVDFISLAEEEIIKRKNDEEACITNFYLLILNIDSSFQKDGFNASVTTKKLISILKEGSDLGVHTIVYSYSYKSVTNSGIVPDMFESRIVLKGDSDEIMGRKEPAKEKTAYLYAPTPITSINPDLFNIYSKMNESKLLEHECEVIEILKELIKDLE